MIVLRATSRGAELATTLTSVASLPNAAFALAVEAALLNQNLVYIAIYNDAATSPEAAFKVLRG